VPAAPKRTPRAAPAAAAPAVIPKSTGAPPTNSLDEAIRKSVAGSTTH
jgi:hypothetical protein